MNGVDREVVIGIVMLVAIVAWSSVGPFYVGVESPLAALGVALLGALVLMLVAGGVAAYLAQRDRY
jgi:hypothetical protein